MLGLGEAMSLARGRQYHAGGGATVRTGSDSGAATIRRPCCTAASRLQCEAIGPARARRWQALKDLHPPPQIEAMLDARIAELGPAADGCRAASRGPRAERRRCPGVLATAAASACRAAAQATVNLSIAPALKSRLTGEAHLFVFAREPGSQGPPLAAKRLTSSAIGTQIHLSSADSMLPGRVLAAGQRVSITARVSFSGQPLPAAGDLYGELTYDVGRDGVRDLVIDRVAQ